MFEPNWSCQHPKKIQSSLWSFAPSWYRGGECGHDGGGYPIGSCGGYKIVETGGGGYWRGGWDGGFDGSCEDGE